MIAVFKTGGKQYSVKPGQVIKIEKIDGKKGDTLSFNDILVVGDNSSNVIGNPLIKGASIEATIIDQIRDKKIIIFKKRRRKNYRSTQGHRQYLTVLRIESISHGDKKSSAPKLVKKTKIKESATTTSTSKILAKNNDKKDDKKIVKKTVAKKVIKKKQIVKKKVAKKTTKSK